MRTFTKLIAALAVALLSTNTIHAQCTTTVDEFQQIEDFESGLQLLQNVSGDDFDWSLSNTTTGTPTNNTGPTAAFQGDYFLYTETSGIGTNEVAIVETSCLDFDANTSPWMSFYLHMYEGTAFTQAQSMGQLVVQVTTNPTATTPTWSTLTGGNFNSYNSNSWALFTIDLSSYANQTIKIRFRAQTGSTGGFQQAYAYGDRSIDSMYVSDGMSVTKISCPGADDGALYAEAKYGTEPYSYSWNTGDTTQSISSLAAGTYTVTITDSANSTKVLVKTLVEPSVPVPTNLSASSTQFCEADSLTVELNIDYSDGDAEYSFTTAYQSSNLTGSNPAASKTFNFPGTPAFATSNATLTFEYRGDMEGGGEYLITRSENSVPIDTTTPSGNAHCSGTYASNTYDLDLDSLNHWALDDTVKIIGDPSDGITAACNNLGGVRWQGRYTLKYTYTNTRPYWFTAACDSNIANAVDSGFTVSVNPTTTTTYYVRYYNIACDLWGDCDSITVTVDSQPTITVSPASANYCGGSAATLTASGANSYSWAPQTGLNIANVATVQASPASTTSYIVTGTDGNGCEGQAGVTVTVTTGPSASISGTNVSCNGGNNGAATSSVSGGTGSITYAWNTGGTSSSISGLTAGTYTVTISDSIGCDDTETITITEPSAISINLATSNTCNGSSNGTVIAFANGGTGTKTFSWSTGSTSNFIFGLAAGNYTLTVTDANGCTATDTAVITQPSAPLTVSNTATTNVLCFGENTGSLTAAGAGGTPSYTYSWSNGSSGATISGLTAGNYTVTVLDAASCFTGAIYTVTQPSTAVSVSVTSSTNVTCNGGNDGAATAAGTGGTGTKTYAWSSGATTATASGLTAGTYTVTTTDANGCTDTDDVTITEPNAVSATFTTSNVSCNGGNDGSATAAGTGGSGTFSSFAWTTGSTSATASGLTAGTYTVTVTDNNGCTGTASTTITQPTVLSVSATGTNVSCNGGSTGAASASASGGTSGYTFSWSNSGSGSSITGLTAGTYTVTATDANGCTETDVVTITEPAALVASIGTPTNVSCNGGNDGSATASAAGGTTSYTYAWSGGGGTSATASSLTAGTYTVTVTDANGCTDTESVTITQPTALVASIGTPTNVSCNGGNDGSATASASGGTTAYTYAWSGGGGSSATASSLTAGTYTVTVTDANGCTDTESVTITQPTALVASATVSSALDCNGDSDGQVTASGSGGTTAYTYSWNTGATTATATGLAAGTYSVTLTDANGCTDSTSVVLTEPTVLTASATVSSTLDCNGDTDGALTASATGGTTAYTYSWNTGGTSATVTGLGAGTYSVTITDANGCTDSASVVLTEPTVLVAAASVDDNVSCNGGNDGEATASATGGTTAYTYAWSGGGGSSATATGLTAGTYTVTITDANGCTDTESVTITEPTAIVASASVISTLDCNGDTDGQVTASATGGTGSYTYSWNTGGTAALETGLGAGTYSVTITDANGCTDSASVTLTEPAALVASASVTESLDCNGDTDGEVTAAGTGGTGSYTYSWNTGGTAATETGLGAGTYSVTVTDANGCTDSASVTLTEPTAMVASATVSATLDCNGDTDGQVTASATGGTTAYTYSWSNGATTATATGLGAGTYSVTVTDAGGCTDSASVTLTQPAALVAAASVDDNVSCNGGNDGEATASATGGTTAYTYAWSGGGGSSATATGLTAGTYTVTVTDANGCTDTESVTITEPTAIVASASVTSTLDCNGDTDGQVTASATGGTGSYTYSWNTGGTAALETGLGAGTYSVTITDANGCTDSASVTITEPAALVASASVTESLDCNGDTDGEVTAAGTGGTGSYTYSWNTGGTAATETGLGAGTYSVTVTDANGCTDSASVTLTEPTAMVASATVSATLDCNGDTDGQVTASGTGGTTAYTYSWSNGATTATATGLGAGTYSVTVTDAGGCTDSASVTLTEPTLLVASIGTPTNVSCNGGNDGSATASATGGTGTYTYSWSGGGGSSATATGLTAGTYTVTITDANGCTDTEDVTITEPPVLVASASVTSALDCNGDTDGQVTASGTGGTGSYTYSWNTGGTAALETGLGAGTYSVTITDANGCTDSASVVLTEPAALVASSSVTETLDCNGDTDGEVTASATGGTTAYTYSWNTGGTSATETGLGAGTYSVTVTDANGCTDSSSVTITEPAVLVAATAVDNNVSCNGESDGQATASATGGTTAYTYAWSSGSSTATATGLAAGTFTVTVTDANGCTDTETVTITEPVLLIAATVVDSNVSCNGFSDGGASASATGGTAAYTYSWNNSATTASITGVIAGTYSVTVTDANGCTDSTSVIITEPTTLVASAIVDDSVSCNGFNDGQATASATGGTTGYSYTWSSGATSATATGLTAGTYTVTITDANGCTDTASTTVFEPTVLTVSTSVVNISCNGANDGEATATGAGATPGYSYLWSTGAITATATNLGPGTYSVTATDANGCTETSSATITQPAVLVAATAVDNNVSCNGGNDGEATASATGGTTAYTYAWSTSASTATATGLSAGTFTVTVTDANGCTDTETVTITEPTPVVATAVVDSNVSCNAGSDGGATASGSGGTGAFTYSWSNSATTASITGVAAGTYSVTVTDANGCTDSASVVITEPTLLVSATVVDSNVSCNGFSDGGATASATGGTTAYTYAWSNSATTASITGVVAGTYSVTVTDANGCTDSTSVVITEPASLVASTVADSNVSCNGFSDGGATASATGGTTAYTYSWSNSATTASITGVVAGTYSVTITDANGCTDSSSVTITEPAVLVAATAVDSNVSCNSGNDGVATASAVGGTMTYSFAWSSGANDSTANNLTAGTYTVTVTDANGCTDTETVTITEPDSLISSPFVVSNALCNGDSNGIAIASATGGTTAYSYIWTNGVANDTVSNLPAGTWGVEITDANGCIDSSFVTITHPDSLIIDTTSGGVTNVSCNGGNDGAISTVTTGGTTAYSYSWSNGATTANINTLVAGNYTVTVEDANGCIDTNSFFVDEPDSISNTFTVSNVNCNSGNDGYMISNPSGGTAGYTFVWNTGATTDSIGSLVAGNYTVTITDTNGCTNIFSDSISEPDSLFASIVLEDSALCAGDSSGMAIASATGGTGPYTYNWPTGFTAQDDSLIGLPAGTYVVTVVDNNGCIDSATATIEQPQVLALSIDSTVDVTCEGGSNGFAQLSGLGGTTPYSYAWPNGDTLSFSSNLSGGQTTVTVTDANGCFDTITVTLNETFPLPIVNLGNDTVVCGAIYSLGAGAATSYSWSTGDTTQFINVDSSGYYSVTAGDTNGCANTDTVLVVFNPLLTYSIDVDSSACGLSTGSAEITNLVGGGNFSISWSTGQTSGLIANNLSSGNYDVTVTDQNGCEEVQSFTIVDGNGITSTVASVDALCNANSDGLAMAEGLGGVQPYTYNWSSGDTSDTANNLAAGMYLVTIEDANGCSTIDTAMIGEPDAVVVYASSVNASCGDTNGMAMVDSITPAGTYTYLWSDAQGQTTATADSLLPGLYSVTVTSDNGCVGTSTVIVSNDTAATLVLTTINAACSMEEIGSGEASVIATGLSPFTYIWSNGDTTDTASNLMAGLYYLTVTDTNGCMEITSVTIGSDNVSPSIDLGDDVEVCGTITGIGVASGFANYAWSTLDSTSSILVSSTGTYTVTATDTNGCSAVDSVDVTFFNNILVTSTVTDADCGSNNGAINLTVTNGSGNYTYAWSTGDTTSSLTGLGAGSYVVTTTDTTGCGSIDTITVLQNGAPIIAITSTDPICSDGTDGQAIATVTGGQSPYTYAWSDGSTSDTLSNVSAGLYNLTVTDNNGCEVIESASISAPAPLVISIASAAPSCGDTNGTATATVTGNQGPSTYLWSDLGATDSMFVDSLFAGVYSITVNDSAGCSAVKTITLNDDGAPILVLGSSDNNCDNEEIGTAFVIPFGLAEPFTYAWNDALAQTNDTAINLGAGMYSVTVTDTNGCSSIGMTTVGAFNVSPVVDLGLDITACNDAEVILTPGGQYATYVWSTTASTPSITVTASQSYDVFVTDVNGCLGTDTVLVTLVAPPVVDLGLDTVVCAEDGSSSLVLDAGSFNNYAWSTNETTQTIEITADGLYSVTVSDVAECAGSDDIIVVFDNCVNVSAEEIEDAVNASMNVYPNPNRGLFFIELDGLDGGNYKMQLMNMSGQFVRNEMISVQSGITSRSEVDLRDIESGVYMIVIEGDKIRMDGRVIINN